MASPKNRFAVAAAFLSMTLLILDTRTALTGASDGVDICIRTVIPSLFPFFVIASFLTGMLSGAKFTLMRPLCKLLGIPYGAESFLLIGLLGGYPVGAQCIAQAYEDGALPGEDAKRMLGFCSNAGPAFLFGMAGHLFTSPWCPWILWLIHIVSALIVGIVLRQVPSSPFCRCTGRKVSFPNALRRGIRSMAEVCAWVILFRVVIAFSQRWFLWLLPQTAQAVIFGLLELSNGCISLAVIPAESVRFILCAFFLGCGGLCVGMQTMSVVGKLGTGAYFPGKLLQSTCSLLAAIMIQRMIFPQSQQAAIPPALIAALLAGIAAFTVVILRKNKKRSSNRQAVPV